MEMYDLEDNSLPYIDDTSDGNFNHYNLKIIENYQDKNRNIEISNQFPERVECNSLSPVAPLADETEFSDSGNLQDEEICERVKKLVTNQTGMKLVIRGYNSTISIQGLDNKSSITFKRKSDKFREVVGSGKGDKQKDKTVNGSIAKTTDNKLGEKPRKGRWKLLTRSLISKSARFERSLEERYPKYVLLKNEEDVVKEEEEEFYPKMIILDNKTKSKENSAKKSEFNFKKSFKNKTKPIDALKTESKDFENQKKILAERSLNENRNVIIKNKITVEEKKKLSPGKIGKITGDESDMTFKASNPSPQVFNEIQGIFEDTLKLCSGERLQEHSEECYSSRPPPFCSVSCHDPCCCQHPSNQPPVYMPVYPPYSKPGSDYKHSNTQTIENEFEGFEQEQILKTEQEEFQNLSFGLLSGFFPRVVIMKTYQNEAEDTNEVVKQTKYLGSSPPPPPPPPLPKNVPGLLRHVDFVLGFPNASPTIQLLESSNDEYELSWLAMKKPSTKSTQRKSTGDISEPKAASIKTLEVPQPDLIVKSRMSFEGTKLENKTFFPTDSFVNCLTVNEVSSSDEDHKTKTDDSETTEYLHYCETSTPDNDSVKPSDSLETLVKTKENSNRDDQTLKTLTLTKVGYKMYDNLTKLSLNREKDVIEKAEIKGCGCDENGTKTSPYNITLESDNRIVKVTVPDNELNFQIVNSEGTDIQIGVTGKSIAREVEDKSMVRRDELWHSDAKTSRESKRLLLAKKEKIENASSSTKGLQTIRLSLAENKEVVFSIGLNNEEKNKKDNIKEKFTKEAKVGTDDFNLAGGDFVCTFDGSHQSLSPRTGELLKNLQKKLELGEKERKFLTEKINQAFTDQKYQNKILPGVFLVQQIGPRASALKNSLKVSPSSKAEKKDVANQLREYYCEECLATMRIFEDENPSVKSMVDKYETIIQLESY